MAELDQLSNLVNIIGGIQGTESKTKTSGTKTTQTNISDQGIQELIRGILAGEGGVADVGGAARRSGLYNSTTQDTQMGNLYARAANQAELARSPTVETGTTIQEMEAPGVGLGTVAGAIGGMQAGKQVLDMFGLGAGAGAGALGGAGVDAAATLLGPEVAKFGSVASNAANATGAAGVNTAATGSAGGLFGTSIGAGPAGGVGFNLGTAVPLGGSFLTGILGGKDAAKDPMSLALNAATGFAALGPVGLLAAPLASIAGSIFGDKSIICTALMEKGLLDEKLYEKGQRYLQALPNRTRVGYLVWATGIAEKIRQGSKFWTRLCLPFAQQRTALLATEGTLRDHVRNPLGTVTRFIGEPLCWMIGAVMLAGQTQKLSEVK
tara:strand:- start:178 stop:1317 length:1140 start_codon:yes stop_codon:yes gene_type:complete